MTVSDEWIENNNGNWVWVGLDGIRATVYTTGDGMWGAIWNGPDGKPRRLKEKFGCAEDAQSAIETADREGSRSQKWWPPDDEWIKSKKGGYYRKVKGMVVSVKQAGSKSWYAVRMGGALLGQDGRPMWFTTAEEARRAVNDSAAGRGTRSWIGHE
jgi:hypothetical protein